MSFFQTASQYLKGQPVVQKAAEGIDVEKIGNAIGSFVGHQAFLIVPSCVAATQAPLYFTAGIVMGIFLSRVDKIVTSPKRLEFAQTYTAVVHPFVNHPVNVCALMFMGYFGEPNLSSFLIGMNLGFQVGPYIPAERLLELAFSKQD